MTDNVAILYTYYSCAMLFIVRNSPATVRNSPATVRNSPATVCDGDATNFRKKNLAELPYTWASLSIALYMRQHYGICSVVALYMRHI